MLLTSWKQNSPQFRKQSKSSNMPWLNMQKLAKFSVWYSTSWKQTFFCIRLLKLLNKRPFLFWSCLWFPFQQRTPCSIWTFLQCQAHLNVLKKKKTRKKTRKTDQLTSKFHKQPWQNTSNSFKQDQRLRDKQHAPSVSSPRVKGGVKR